MKKWLAAFLAALILLMGAACAEEARGPLLWRVTDGEGGELYLFGTIHAADETAYPLPDPVTEAFESCDALALEVDVTAAALQILLTPGYTEAMYLPQGDSIDAHLSPATLEAVDAYLSGRGIARMVYQGMTPMAVNSLVEEFAIQDSGLSAEQGVDMRLAAMAKERDMPIREIESAAFQFQLLASFSDEMYDLMLLSTVSQPEAAARELRGLFTAWRDGDEAQLLLYTQSDLTQATAEEARLIEEYEKALLLDRNEGMASFARDALQSGERVFLAVGTAHMLGQGGVVALLTDMGYTVEEIGG